MEQHVTDRIAAYHDGALTAAQQRRVEAHLAECTVCRAELDTLQSLSTLLHAAPIAETTLSSGRFVAQVGLWLPRHPERTAWQQAAEVVWRMIPVGVLGTLAFVQTVFILGTVLLAVTALAGVTGTLTPAMDWVNHFLGYLPDAAAMGMRGWYHGWLNGLFMVGIVTGFLGMAGLYGSWLASWWLRQQRANGDQ